MRRWQVGDEFEVDGFRFRIAQGKKAARDQKLLVWHDDEWQPITFGIPFVVMDVLGQNEDVLYPHGAGGGYLLNALRQAYRDGWQAAQSRLLQERQKRQEQRRLKGMGEVA